MDFVYTHELVNSTCSVVGYVVVIEARSSRSTLSYEREAGQGKEKEKEAVFESKNKLTNSVGPIRPVLFYRATQKFVGTRSYRE